MTKTKSMLESTLELFKDKYRDDNLGFDRFIEYIILSKNPYFVTNFDHKFEEIQKDDKFLDELEKRYIPQMMNEDKYDYLGDLYIEQQARSTVGRKGQFLTPESLTTMMAKMAIPQTIEPINILDPCVGTGRFLLSAYESAPNASLYGVDIDIKALRVAQANMIIREIPNYYLLHANSLVHDIEGKENWKYANSWFSHYDQLHKMSLPKVDKSQLELTL